MLHSLSRSIKQEADAFLERKPLTKYLSDFGEVFITGSYALDLMTWRDIDMQVHYTKNQPIHTLANKLMADPDVREVKFINFIDHPKPKMPIGHYIGVKIRNPETKEYWKFDAWFFKDKSDYQTNVDFISKVKACISDDDRKLILDLKFDAQRHKDRPPQMASYYIYKAVIEEGLKNREQIKAFLNSYDINA